MGKRQLHLLLIFVWLAAVHFVSKYVIGWDYLITKENQQQARLYAFFSWFVDVPQMGTRIARRSWISGLTRFIPFRQDAAYLYLYMKTLLRTELFAIVLRLTLIRGISYSRFKQRYCTELNLHDFSCDFPCSVIVTRACPSLYVLAGDVPAQSEFESRFIGLYHLVSLAAGAMYPDDSLMIRSSPIYLARSIA